MIQKNILAWFEIPVNEIDKAISFYEQVLNIQMQQIDLGGLQMALFPQAEGGGGMGALTQNENWYKPSSTDGPLLYLSAPSGDLSHELGRVVAAGGKIIIPKKLISESFGYMALFLDCEGNRIALHSPFIPEKIEWD